MMASHGHNAGNTLPPDYGNTMTPKYIDQIFLL